MLSVIPDTCDGLFSLAETPDHSVKIHCFDVADSRFLASCLEAFQSAARVGGDQPRIAFASRSGVVVHSLQRRERRYTAERIRKSQAHHPKKTCTVVCALFPASSADTSQVRGCAKPSIESHTRGTRLAKKSVASTSHAVRRVRQPPGYLMSLK